jgi:hypothetical protein
MQTLEQFMEESEFSIEIHAVTADGDGNGNGNGNGSTMLGIAELWAGTRYVCRLGGSSGGRSLTTVVESDNGPPETLDVIDAIAADAALVEEMGRFEAWARCLGYNPDSRRDEREFRRARRRAQHLRVVLGCEAYQRLLWETERL